MYTLNGVFLSPKFTPMFQTHSWWRVGSLAAPPQEPRHHFRGSSGLAAWHIAPEFLSPPVLMVQNEQ